MKHKGLFITIIIFFLIVNTSHYWEGIMGINVIFIFLLLFLCFLVLTVCLVGQIYFSLREKFRNRHRLFLIGIMIGTLSMVFFYPRGIIDFEKLEGESIFIAQQEGAANCMTTLKLRENKTFIEKVVCFGITETRGTYHLKGDTIFFKYDSRRNKSDFYQFAVIKRGETKNKNYLGDLVRHKDYSDTLGFGLSIIKNHLTK